MTEPFGRPYSGLGGTAIGAHFFESKEIAERYPYHLKPGGKRQVKTAHLNIKNPKKYLTLASLNRDLMAFMRENDLSYDHRQRLMNVAMFKLIFYSQRPHAGAK